MLLVVEAIEGFVALDAGEGPGVAALRHAVPVDLLLLQSCATGLTDKHGHFLF